MRNIKVSNLFCALYAWAVNDWASFNICMARGAQQQFTTTQFHVGKSPNCLKLGLGVWEISIAAGTGADVMAGGAGAAGPAPDVLHQPPSCPYSVYFCKNLHNMGCPNAKCDSSGNPSFRHTFWTKWRIPGYPYIKQKHLGYPGITRCVITLFEENKTN